MEEDKVNPESQSPRPLPSWQEDQVLSRQWLGAVGSSVLPLSETEEEGAFGNMDKEWKDDANQELSQWGNISGQELHPCEEVRDQEFYQQQEEVTAQWEIGVRVQCDDGTQQELYQCKENVTDQELYPWNENDDRYQELSQWKGEGYSDLSLLEDVRGHPHMYQLEVDKRDPKLCQLGDHSDKASSQGEGYNVEELLQWENDKSDQKLSQQEESVNGQGLSQWGEGISCKTWDKPLHTENSEDAQTRTQWRSSSSSSIGTKVSGEEADELSSASPALESPTESEPVAVAALAGGVEKEKPSEPLAPEAEKAPDSPVFSDVVSSSGTESPVSVPHSPPDCSQAWLDLVWHISSEVVCKAELEVQASGQWTEEQGDLEQSTASELEAAAAVEREESPTAQHSPCCLPSPPPYPPGAQALSEQQEEADRASVLSEQECKEGTLAGGLELSQCGDEEDPELSQQEMNKYQETSQGEVCTEQELSPRETGKYQELSPGEAGTEQELFPGEPGSYQELSPGEARTEQELSPGESGSYPELSPGETSTERELSLGEAGSYQELSPGEVCMEQELSPGEAGSYQELSPGEAGSYQELSPGEAGTERELSPGEAGSYQELSQGDDCMEQELYPEDSRRYLEFSDWEECTEKGLSQEAGSSKKLLSWKECSEQELSHEVSNYQELSDWEESTGQELSEVEDSIGQKVSKGNVNRPSMKPSWKNDSDKELMQDSWEHMSVHSTGIKPLLQDEWDDLSVLELSDEEDRDKRLGHFAEDRLPGPIPREAWLEHQAFEPCPQVPFCVLPRHMKAQGPRGCAVSPTFKEQVDPAPRSHPRCSAPQLGAQAFRWQPAPHKHHPSRLRPALRALRGLFCCPCPAPLPED